MKLFILSVGAALISIVSCGQDIPASEVPSVVQNAVQAKFAGASKVDWEKKNALYEAEFKINNTEYAAYIDATGKLVMHKMDIDKNTLPAAVTAAIGRDHNGFTIDDAEKLEKDGVTYYQVELEAKGQKDKKLVFAADGSVATQIAYVH